MPRRSKRSKHSSEVREKEEEGALTKRTAVIEEKSEISHREDEALRPVSGTMSHPDGSDSDNDLDVPCTDNIHSQTFVDSFLITYGGR